MEATLMPKPKGRAQNSKIEQLLVFPEIKNMFELVMGDIVAGKLNYVDFYRNKVLPILPEGHDIKYNNFHAWAKKHLRQKKVVAEHRSLLDKEQEKLRDQIEIRQDATKLMKEFLRGIDLLVDDPLTLAKAGIKPTEIYKIIREEEDRQKALQLRERAENRADAAFAFLVSVARSNELSDDDIEFLEESTKQELIQLKKKDGFYQLPSAGEFYEAEAPAEAPALVSGQIDSEGA